MAYYCMICGKFVQLSNQGRFEQQTEGDFFGQGEISLERSIMSENRSSLPRQMPETGSLINYWRAQMKFDITY